MTMFQGTHPVAMEEVIECIAKYPKENEWVSCSEQLPVNHKAVLVSLAWGTLIIAWRSGSEWYFENGCLDERAIRAWQPLPEPYKKTEEVIRNE